MYECNLIIVESFFQIHKNSVDHWREGNIKKYWRDDKGVYCIMYDSDKWWHYQFDKQLILRWW